MEAKNNKIETGRVMGDESRAIAENQKARSIDRKTKGVSVMHGEEEGR